MNKVFFAIPCNDKITIIKSGNNSIFLSMLCVRIYLKLFTNFFAIFIENLAKYIPVASIIYLMKGLPYANEITISELGNFWSTLAAFYKCIYLKSC